MPQGEVGAIPVGPQGEHMTKTLGAVRLSVVIACYNAAATLEGQLRALEGQDCPVAWELVVADNGSSDASTDIARRYADRLPARVVDASARRGPAHARNVGVRASSGPWLAFCDADDVVASDWLARVCQAMARHPFVGGRVDVHLLNRASVARSRPMEQQNGLQPGSANRLGLPHAGAGNMAIHRAVFDQVGGFDEGIGCLEDTDLCWRVQRAGIPLVFDPDLLLYTRLRAGAHANFRQGRCYAIGHTELERRYGPLAPRAAVDEAPRPRSLRLRRPPSIHTVAWQVGWYVGRLRAHRGEGAPLGGRPLEDPLATG